MIKIVERGKKRLSKYRGKLRRYQYCTTIFAVVNPGINRLGLKKVDDLVERDLSPYV